MPRPSSRYRQVFLTYWRRPAFRWLVGVPAIAWAAWVILGALLNARQPLVTTDDALVIYSAFHAYTLILFLSLPIALVAYVTLVLTHLRAQLDDSLSEMIPASRESHVTVGALMFLTIPAAGYALAVAFDAIHSTGNDFLNGSGLFGPAAVWLSLMTLAAFWSLSRAPWFSLLLIPLVFVALTWTPLSRFAGALFNSGSYDYLRRSLVILSIDCLALFLIFRRLSRRRPEGASRPIFRRQRRATLQDAIARQDARPGPAANGALARVLRRRRGVLAPVAPWVVAGLLAMLLVIVTLLNGPGASDLFRSVLLPAVIPGIVISLIWRERWGNMGYESLFPAARAGFVGELMTATALTLAELWLSTTLAVLVPIALWHGVIRHEANLFALTLAASAAMQVFVFGVMFVAARSRPLLPFVNVLTVLAVVIPITLAWGEAPLISPAGLLAAATVEMILGLSLTAFGYAAWRTADLA